MDKWMVIKWIDGQMDGCLDGWNGLGKMDQEKDGWLNHEWINKGIDEWIDQ